MRSNSSRSAIRRALGDRLGVVARSGRRASAGASEMGRAVPAPLGLGLLQRPPQADGDQRVLERRPRGVVHVDVAGRHAADAEPLGEVGQPAVARPVGAPERPLQLDPEAVAAEGAGQPPPERLRRRCVGGAGPSAARSKRARERPVASAARRGRRAPRPAPRASSAAGRGEGLTPGRRPRSAVGLGDQPAEVAPARRRLSTSSVRWNAMVGEPSAVPSSRRRRSGAPRATCRPARTPSPPRRRRGR